MGRLFWKLFLFIWLGQMAAVFGTGALFWAERRGLVAHLQGAHLPLPADRMEGPPPSFMRGHPPGDGAFRGEQPPFPPGGRRPGLPVWPVMAGCLASLLCAAGLAWYFAKPIRRLRSGFDALSAGNLDVRVMPGMGARRDDLADLGWDFDRMAERMQAVLEGQRRLLHDVSHEMRSPLARLQAAIGLARQQPGRVEDSMLRIERESERMNRLIGELLTLSRLEAGGSMAVGEVDMDEVMTGVVEDARFEGLERKVEIDYVPGRMGRVQGNAEMLHRAIENVVRNALRFSPVGEAVHIEAGMNESGDFEITILDQGPGVDAQDLLRIFTPFFRGTAETNGDGYGLGLAIARQVVIGSGGHIAAMNTDAAGLLVSIQIPAGRS